MAVEGPQLEGVVCGSGQGGTTINWEGGGK